MTVWVVTESIDYDMEQVAAVYSSQALADAHVAELGGWIAECEVLDVTIPNVTDPAKIQERQAKREARQREYDAREAETKRQAISRASVKPHPGMGLCHCPTFSPSYNWINDHGYCTYCGGFTIAVFRAHRGEAALQAEIDKLATHDRERMRLIAADTPSLPL